MSTPRVAILGGGVASMTAAFYLTHPHNPRPCEVTVFQMGWRLGGKGASGRGEYARIEEHGLHVWMGFYENAFKTLRDCYEELDRPSSSPVSSLDEAFIRHDGSIQAELLDEGDWDFWPLDLPRRGGEPGDGRLMPSLWDHLHGLLEWIRKTIGDVAQAFDANLDEQPQEEFFKALGAGGGMGGLFEPLQKTIEELLDDPEAMLGELLEQVLEFIANTWKRISTALAPWLVEFRSLRRAWIMLEMGLVHLNGFVQDKLIYPERDREAGRLASYSEWLINLDHIEGEDYRVWMERHGASSITLESAIIRALQALVFSVHHDGAAGTGINGLMRMMFSYKGSLFYKMTAGMGDIVFAPLYEVLVKRGVKFRFFNRVVNIALDDDNTAVNAFEVLRQVETIAADGHYEPLVDINGLPCWPSEPIYDQLVDGHDLQAAMESEQFTLEDVPNNWDPEGSQETFSVGEDGDFQQVVLGISAGALGEICSDFIDENNTTEAADRWRGMLDSLQTTATLGVQLWFNKSLDDLGWPPAGEGLNSVRPPLLTGYEEPLDTWADLTHLIPEEEWPDDIKPGHLAYLCSPLKEGQIDPALPRGERIQEARTLVENWLNTSSFRIWPSVATSTTFDWNALTAPQGSQNLERLAAQYISVNTNPSDRYVLTVPGSPLSRMMAHEAGYERLVVAGDWIKTGINAGCVEAATMGGMQAARALTGFPVRIIGDRPVTEPMPRQFQHSGPAYVWRSGEAVAPAPYEAHGARTYIFLLKPDRPGQLQHICDRHLNDPRGAELEWRYMSNIPLNPIQPHVMLVIANIDAMTSSVPSNRRLGTMAEVDIGFWIPAFRTSFNGPIQRPEAMNWFMPYMFVPQAPAVIAGRELFGFHKALCHHDWQDDDQGFLETLAVRTMAFRTFGPSEQAERYEIMRVTRQESDDKGHSNWHSWDNVFENFSTSFQIPFPPPLGIEPGVAPFVFLKQFRDVVDSSRACYQAIIEAEARAGDLHGGGLMPGTYNIDLSHLASQPLIRDLGLSTSYHDMRGFWLDYDFTVDLGIERWRAEG